MLTYQQAKKAAQSCGYDIREGSYQGTTDDRLGRWYVVSPNGSGFRPWGAGYATRTAAWHACLDRMHEFESMERFKRAAKSA